MNPFRSVGARLTLALALVVAVALGVTYAMVLPPLERNLTQAKLDQLSRSAVAEANRFPDPDDFAFNFSDPAYLDQLEEYINDAADATNARVVVLDPLAGGRLSAIADAHETSRAPDVSNDSVALAAAVNGAARDTVTRPEGKFAEVAFAIPATFARAPVLLFVAPLDDTLANVQLVKRRLLTAAGVALLVAALLGFGGSWFFARRLRRLERAAEQIASGRLDEPVVDRGSDEVGELAKTFERMRRACSVAPT